jgi:hypothetical protein
VGETLDIALQLPGVCPMEFCPSGSMFSKATVSLTVRESTWNIATSDNRDINGIFNALQYAASRSACHGACCGHSSFYQGTPFRARWFVMLCYKIGARQSVRLPKYRCELVGMHGNAIGKGSYVRRHISLVQHGHAWSNS